MIKMRIVSRSVTTTFSSFAPQVVSSRPPSLFKTCDNSRILVGPLHCSISRLAKDSKPFSLFASRCSAKQTTR
jgi:hypothetical protein